MPDNENTNENTEQKVSMEDLKSKALLYGIVFKGNVSRETLEKQIKDALSTPKLPVGVQVTAEDEPNDLEYFDDNEDVFKPKRITRKEVQEIKYQATLMMKVRVTNLNPEETDADNVYAGVVTNFVRAARYIPFNRNWYVEQCLVDKLMVDKLQVFVNDIDPNTRRPNGNKKAKLVKHYNVEFVR